MISNLFSKIFIPNDTNDEIEHTLTLSGRSGGFAVLGEILKTACCIPKPLML